MNNMIIVTGGNGFIGKNLVNSLRSKGKEVNVVDFHGDIYTDPISLLNHLSSNANFVENIEMIYHQGACTDTTCYDPSHMLDMNLNYSIALLNICMRMNIRMVYASSASIYGDGPFVDNEFSDPKNIYAKSKSMFDDYVRCFLKEKDLAQIVGLRYFNVYGPGEHKKEKMASVMHQFYHQHQDEQKIKIFKNSENYTRDFISVEDVVKVNLHFLENESISGIYNCGTGVSRSFCDIARIMQTYCDFEIEEIDMPSSLHGKYQAFTQSDNTRLIENALYTDTFLTLEEGIDKYMRFLQAK